MRNLIVATALAAVASLMHAPDIEQSQLIGKWTGRIERPGLGGGRRMTQIGTAEFLVDHRFVCHFASPDQQPLSELGRWRLRTGRLFVNTDEANGKKVKRRARLVEISHQPLETRLPIRSGAWFLVLRPIQTSQ